VTSQALPPAFPPPEQSGHRGSRPGRGAGNARGERRGRVRGDPCVHPPSTRRGQRSRKGRKVGPSIAPPRGRPPAPPPPGRSQGRGARAALCFAPPVPARPPGPSLVLELDGPRAAGPARRSVRAFAWAVPSALRRAAGEPRIELRGPSWGGERARPRSGQEGARDRRSGPRGRAPRRRARPSPLPAVQERPWNQAGLTARGAPGSTDAHTAEQEPPQGARPPCDD